MTPERKEELKEMLAGMRLTSNSFYRSATQIGCHAFIEFTGFLNEFIKIAERNLESGVDFTECNAHSGKPLQIFGHEAAYIGEKLNCLYGDALKGPLWEAFEASFKSH